MENIKINDTIYSIPTSWDDVCINKWRSLISVQKYLKEDMTDSEKLDIKLNIISVLTDIPYDILINTPGEFYSKIMELLDFYTNESLKVDLTPSIKVLDVEYRLISFEKLTLGDKANIDILRDGDSIENRLGRVMSILYRSEKEGNLTTEQLDEKELTFNEHLSINDVYATMIFFLNIIQVFNKNTQFYSVMKKRKELMKKLPIHKRVIRRMKLLLDNIIINSRFAWQKGRFWILTKHLK
jgi:hypothetical protein